MEYKIKIVDQIPGAGKSFSAINYINNSDKDRRFMVITPFLDEIKRYQQYCPSRKFKTPSEKRGKGSKFVDIKQLIRNGDNIVSTHVLFHRFDAEIIELCKLLRYTLIMDEVADVLEETDYTQDDIQTLLNNFCDIDEETGLLSWREEYQNWVGKYSDAKNMCNLGGLALVRDTLLFWLFPVEVFKVFEEVYVLTYMFDAQIQKYYYDFFNVEYEYMSVAGDAIDNYHFVEYDPKATKTYNFNDLIHICDNERLNAVGDGYYNLSSSWFKRNKKTAVMKLLKDNIYNYFFNIRKSKSTDNLWTTMNAYKSELSGKGYTKGFLYINARAMNLYRTRTSLAYVFNVFLNPMVKALFEDHNVAVNEDGYALSEMLQWIWRSAIRDGKEIWIYIPSRRMRELLQNWINEISGNKEIVKNMSIS